MAYRRDEQIHTARAGQIGGELQLDGAEHHLVVAGTHEHEPHARRVGAQALAERERIGARQGGVEEQDVRAQALSEASRLRGRCGLPDDPDIGGRTEHGHVPHLDHRAGIPDHQANHHSTLRPGEQACGETRTP